MFELTPDGKRIYTDAAHRVTQDGLLLSDFARIKPGWRAVDIGCGCGAAGLRLASRGAERVLLIDISESACALAERSALEGGFAGVEVLCADAREWRTSKKFDAALCNPPYFTDGKRSSNPERRAARHADSLTLGDACAAAARALKQGGEFYLCFPPSRLADAVCELRARRLEPKTMAFAVNRSGARWLCLVRAVYFGGAGLTISDDIDSEDL